MNHQFRPLLQFSVFIVIALFFSACSQIEAPPPRGHAQARPMLNFNDSTTLTYQDKDQIVWILQTTHLERWNGSDKIVAAPFKIEGFDSLGNQVGFLSADSGEADAQLNFAKVYGNARARSPKGALVQADSLNWDRRYNKIQTQSKVRVVSESGDVMMGIGFESDSKLETWKIIQVKGILQDVKTLTQAHSSNLISSSHLLSSSSKQLSSQANRQPSQIPFNPFNTRLKQIAKKHSTLSEQRH